MIINSKNKGTDRSLEEKVNVFGQPSFEIIKDPFSEVKSQERQNPVLFSAHITSMALLLQPSMLQSFSIFLNY